jgi:hypothetical protein
VKARDVTEARMADPPSLRFGAASGGWRMKTENGEARTRHVLRGEDRRWRMEKRHFCKTNPFIHSIADCGLITGNGEGNDEFLISVISVFSCSVVYIRISTELV